jgi:hypothetical protein
MEGGQTAAARRPGQHALEQAQRLAAGAIATGLAVLFLLAGAAILGLRGWPLATLALASIAVVVLADRHLEPRYGRWLRGGRGEQAVGAILDGLAGEGWHVTHDVSLGRGNVDHVLVGPGGIFAVETKSHRGRIAVDRLPPKMLKQAYAEKKLLEAITGLAVEPLLVFSDAWLVGSVPARRQGVTVLPARLLPFFISRRRPTMSVGEARALHERLAAALGQG